MGLTIKPKKEGHWDLVSLGEVMVRFDPGTGGSRLRDHLKYARAAASTTSHED